MARFPLGLGLVLTVCMAATRPSSPIRAGSPDSSQWWDTKDFAEFTKTAQARRAARDLAGLESVYARGYQRATELGNRRAQISYLSNLGTVRMLSLRYAPALEAYLGAITLAEQAADWISLGAVAVNLSQLYQSLGDPNAAITALERGKVSLDRLRIAPPYKAQLLMRLRSVRAQLQQNSTQPGAMEPRYQDAVEAARQSDDPNAEAAAWHLLGEEEIAAGNLEDAEAALGKALRLRRSHAPENLGFSYAALGALRLAQADRATGKERLRRANEAETFTDRAMGTGPLGPRAPLLLHQRALIREVLGETNSTLEDFSAAVRKASEWNGAVPAALSLVTATNAATQQEVFDSFVEAAAREALRSGDRKWAADALLTLEANRAASLRESRELAPVWKQRLPAAYWETLGRLNEQEARDLTTSGTVGSRSKRLRLELTEMESTAGVGVSVILPENFRTRSSLNDIQQGLGESHLLLSFYLGKQESYLWATTRRTLKLYRLPAGPKISEDVSRFREAIMSGQPTGGGQPAGEGLGADLYQRLFGSLSHAERAKKSWLLSLDGALFELPFAALVSDYEGGRPVYVIERHSLQQIPGALFLTRDTAPRTDFLGVADPVYNSADPRLKLVSGLRRWMPHLPAAAPDDRGQLNRLVSSSRELHRSSESWQAMTASQGHPVKILEGTAAQRDAFLQVLPAAPSTIHLATHVLASATQPDQTFLAFSLDASGSPGLLSTAQIGMLNVPGALVVMTGCATATGDVRVGAGLLGLTRAWMMAGASTVVATKWPVPDTDGDLIPAFYRNLRTGSPAEALRLSQVDRIHSGTWQASPSYWAAFQVTGHIAGGGR